MAVFLVAMVTANPLVYMHVQGPLGLIVGASLALVALGASARREPTPEAATPEPVARLRPAPVRPEAAPVREEAAP